MINDKKVNGLIIEANPITKGHIKIIKEAKKNADILICLMAGNYVQRGEFSIYNKYDRARALIKYGADMVFEMPVEYTLSSAKYYARANINILNRLGIVDYLIFGSNINDVNKLNKISDEINNAIKKSNFNSKHWFIAYSYPKYIEEITSIKLTPNDILGVEYLSSLKEFKSKIVPITIKRDENLKSASEIREILIANNVVKTSCTGELCEPVKIDGIKYSTPHTLNIHLTDYINEKIFYSLKNNTNLTSFYDIDNDFKNNILKIFEKGFTDYDDLLNKLHKKHLTLANVKRKLLHILLDIKEKDVKNTDYGKKIKFIRLLAIKKEATKYLKFIKLPFITNYNKQEYKNFYKKYGFNIENDPSLIINYHSSLFYDYITHSKNLEGTRKFMTY